ncbi:MAG: uracil-DNA glycosylase [Firmicutes bacterium]|nr:uracil-DNA glycosylase [Bacillota bacterium]
MVQLSFLPASSEEGPVREAGREEKDLPPGEVEPDLGLASLKEACLRCQACGLRRGAKQVVFGAGSPQAAIMLVGEGPGRQEDELGEPFVGAAGQLLDKVFAALKFRREELYITNIVKCRPPGNRLPTPREVRACRPYLQGQIRLIKPRIIVCLGALAGQNLIGPQLRITRHRGRWVQRGEIMLLPTFHPAALLRDPGRKRPFWEDFKAVARAYEELK